jgi:hypothetical protein
MSQPLPDALEEARRVSKAAEGLGVTVRLLGGVGIALRCPSALQPPLSRPYADLDAVVRAKQSRAVLQLLSQLGYVPDEQFNAIHGGERLLAADPLHGRQFDVFYERIQLCHKIDLRGRLEVPGAALAASDLLLMKLQVFEATHKDLTDICALAADHPFGQDPDGVDLDYLVALVAEDWGLWRTTTMVARRAIEFARDLHGFVPAERAIERLSTYVRAADAAPKSRAWRLRDRVGDRKRWYELPEEK